MAKPANGEESADEGTSSDWVHAADMVFTDIEGAPAVTEEQPFDKLYRELSETVAFPVWGVVLIAFAAGLLFLCIAFFCIKRCCRRRKDDCKKGLGDAVEDKAIKPLWDTYQDKKEQPDTEELKCNEDGESEDQESVESDINLGRLKFKLDYDFKSNNLAVTVIQASDLPGVFGSGPPDPYVKIYLLPGQKKKHETKSHKKTSNPIFNETFNLKVPHAEIASNTLVFAIFDFWKNVQIGQVQLGLNNFDLSQTLEEWQDLTSVELSKGQISATLTE